jgi:threonine dehydrogenase-like Zn-dependent dehydrogenase
MALRSVRPGGVLSSLGVYSGKLVAPYEAIHAGLGDQRIVTTLCPGGKERMRRLMSMVLHDRLDLTPLVTHAFTLEQLPEAFELFSHAAAGVMKVGIYPAGVPQEEVPMRDPAGVGC